MDASLSLLLCLCVLFAGPLVWTASSQESRTRTAPPSEAELAKLPRDGGPEFNRLVFEKSPYLQQHARNPVDWYPWGEEAFERARTDDKPVFLSIGYSTCHWCHVMEHESFEDEEVAALLNRDFVCVKVDREERPDLDAVYMQVTQAMTGSGGWPMTVILTPDKQPFFSGTYFPKTSRFGQRWVWPSRQNSQAKHGITEETTTRSPSWMWATPAPTAATWPQNSCPMTRGGGRRGLRLANCSSSEPQIPAAATRMRSSPGLGEGTGISWTWI